MDTYNIRSHLRGGVHRDSRIVRRVIRDRQVRYPVLGAGRMATQGLSVSVSNEAATQCLRDILKDVKQVSQLPQPWCLGVRAPQPSTDGRFVSPQLRTRQVRQVRAHVRQRCEFGFSASESVSGEGEPHTR